MGGTVKPGPVVDGPRSGAITGGASDMPESESCLSTAEKLRVEDRIAKVLLEIDSKKVAVKNLRLSLDKIDMTE